MAHSAPKLPACANCGHAFAADENYCPTCGQQNHPLDLSFGHVAEEVLEGVLHFDGKVFRTLRQLLFAPGALTRHFWEGKRVAFVPPVRLYVFISFVFFLLLSLTLHAPEHGEATIGGRLRRGALEFRADSARLARTLPLADSLRLRALLAARRQVHLLNGILNLGVSGDTSDYRRLGSTLYTAHDWQALPTYSAREIDALLRRTGQEPTFTSRFTLRQGRRLFSSTEQELSHQFVRGISLMMFVLMPVFALLLKLLYRRQKRFYLAHLMFAIHVHCFAFLLFCLNMVFGLLAHAPSKLILALLPLLAAYLLVAMHTAY